MFSPEQPLSSNMYQRGTHQGHLWATWFCSCYEALGTSRSWSGSARTSSRLHPSRPRAERCIRMRAYRSRWSVRGKELMGTRLTWCPYRRTYSIGSRTMAATYLRSMGRQACYNKESILRWFAVGVPSGRIRKVTAGQSHRPLATCRPRGTWRTRLHRASLATVGGGLGSRLAAFCGWALQGCVQPS